MMNRLSHPVVSVPQAKPKFGFVSGPAILRAVDYASLGTSTVGQNMGIYGTVIASRLWQSRSPNERWENARRDVLGWYNWFMGSPIIQTGLVLGLPLVLGASGAASKRLLVTRLNQNASPLKKLFTLLLEPNKLFMIASDAQIHQHKNHILESLGKAGAKAQIGKVAALFEKARNHRAIVSFIGLAYTFFALGVGIIWLNIFLTKLALKKQQDKNGQQSPMAGRFQGISQPQSRPWGVQQNVVQQIKN